MSEFTNDRPPMVTFEYRAVEDRAATQTNGHYSTKDVPFASIMRPGSKDVLEVEATQWLKRLEEDARQGRAPQSWAEGFSAMFERWKKGEEIPVEGTPIKGWTPLSPAQQKDIITAGFRTVEELAQASDPEVGSIGIGAYDLRKKARTWIEQANGPGKILARLEALEVQNKELQALNSQLLEKVKTSATGESKK